MSMRAPGERYDDPRVPTTVTSTHTPCADCQAAIMRACSCMTPVYSDSVLTARAGAVLAHSLGFASFGRSRAVSATLRIKNAFACLHLRHPVLAARAGAPAARAC
jgi:hypothetical protein